MTVLFDEEITNQYLKEKKIQPFRSKQIFHELFKNQNISRDEMTTIPKELKNELSTQFEIINLSIEQVIETEDTTKFAFKTYDGYTIEAVLMFHRSKRIDEKLNRITLCLSSQI